MPTVHETCTCGASLHFQADWAHVVTRQIEGFREAHENCRHTPTVELPAFNLNEFTWAVGERREDDDETPPWMTTEARLARARDALIDTGYFTADQVGDDIAPRIIELWSAAISPTGRITQAIDDLTRRGSARFYLGGECHEVRLNVLGWDPEVFGLALDDLRRLLAMDPADPPKPWPAPSSTVCPECRQGKCQNCTLTVLDDQDNTGPCRCPRHADTSAHALLDDRG